MLSEKWQKHLWWAQGLAIILQTFILASLVYVSYVQGNRQIEINEALQKINYKPSLAVSWDGDNRNLVLHNLSEVPIKVVGRDFPKPHLYKRPVLVAPPVSGLEHVMHSETIVLDVEEILGADGEAPRQDYSLYLKGKADRRYVTTFSISRRTIQGERRVRVQNRRTMEKDWRGYLESN